MFNNFFFPFKKLKMKFRPGSAVVFARKTKVETLALDCSLDWKGVLLLDVILISISY